MEYGGAGSIEYPQQYRGQPEVGDSCEEARKRVPNTGFMTWRAFWQSRTANILLIVALSVAAVVIYRSGRYRPVDIGIPLVSSTIFVTAWGLWLRWKRS
jgi:hypothetical protein